jgi:hypothetical protein
LAIGINQEQMANTFEEWNKGELDSFLIDITKDILKFKDSDGSYFFFYIDYASLLFLTKNRNESSTFSIIVFHSLSKNIYM